MRWKLFVEFCLTMSVIFLIAGDLFLPQPYRSNSQQLKISINQFIVGLLPSRRKIIDINTEININC